MVPFFRKAPGAASNLSGLVQECLVTVNATVGTWQAGACLGQQHTLPSAAARLHSTGPHPPTQDPSDAHQDSQQAHCHVCHQQGSWSSTHDAWSVIPNHSSVQHSLEHQGVAPASSTAGSSGPASKRNSEVDGSITTGTSSTGSAGLEAWLQGQEPGAWSCDSFIQQQFRQYVQGVRAHRSHSGAVLHGPELSLGRRRGAKQCPRAAVNRVAQRTQQLRDVAQRAQQLWGVGQWPHGGSLIPPTWAVHQHRQRVVRAAREARQQHQQQQPLPLPSVAQQQQQQQERQEQQQEQQQQQQHQSLQPPTWQQVQRSNQLRCRLRSHPSAAAFFSPSRGWGRSLLAQEATWAPDEVLPELARIWQRARRDFRLHSSSLCSSGLDTTIHGRLGCKGSWPLGSPLAATRCTAQRDEQGQLQLLPRTCVGAGSSSSSPAELNSASGGSSSKVPHSLCVAGVGCDLGGPPVLRWGRRRKLWTQRWLAGPAERPQAECGAVDGGAEASSSGGFVPGPALSTLGGSSSREGSNAAALDAAHAMSLGSNACSSAGCSEVQVLGDDTADEDAADTALLGVDWALQQLLEAEPGSVPATHSAAAAAALEELVFQLAAGLDGSNCGSSASNGVGDPAWPDGGTIVELFSVTYTPPGDSSSSSWGAAGSQGRGEGGDGAAMQGGEGDWPDGGSKHDAAEGEVDFSDAYEGEDLAKMSDLHPIMAAAVAEPYVFRTQQGLVYGFWSKCPLG